MNTDRRADLQRKLSVAPVPKPPAGLAERIKTEIPKELRFSAERERTRLSSSVRLSLAVAASVVVIISSAFLALRVVSTSGRRQESTSAAARVRALPQAAPASVPPPPMAQEAEAPKALDQELKPAPARAKTARKEKKQFAPEAPKVAESIPAQPQPSAVAERVTVQTAANNEEPASQTEARDEHAAGTIAKVAAAPAAPPAAAYDKVAVNGAVRQQPEITKSPISGKIMMRSGDGAKDAPAGLDVQAKPWKDASPELKIEILKAELARGADPKEVVRIAREAGLNEFADSVEKPKR